MDKIFGLVNQSIQSTVARTATPSIGQITGTRDPVSGSYTVHMDGYDVPGVQNVTRAKWNDKDWVNVEQAAGGYRITGVAGMRK